MELLQLALPKLSPHYWQGWVVVTVCEGRGKMLTEWEVIYWLKMWPGIITAEEGHLNIHLAACSSPATQVYSSSPATQVYSSSPATQVYSSSPAAQVPAVHEQPRFQQFVSSPGSSSSSVQQPRSYQQPICKQQQPINKPSSLSAGARFQQFISSAWKHPICQPSNIQQLMMSSQPVDFQFSHL